MSEKEKEPTIAPGELALYVPLSGEDSGRSNLPLKILLPLTEPFHLFRRKIKSFTAIQNAVEEPHDLLNVSLKLHETLRFTGALSDGFFGDEISVVNISQVNQQIEMANEDYNLVLESPPKKSTSEVYWRIEDYYSEITSFPATDAKLLEAELAIAPDSQVDQIFQRLTKVSRVRASSLLKDQLKIPVLSPEGYSEEMLVREIANHVRKESLVPFLSGSDRNLRVQAVSATRSGRGR